MRHLTQHMPYAWASLQPLWIQEKGATAAEYSILVGFIALVIVAAVGLFGIALDGVFTGLTSGVKIALGIP